MNQNKKLMYLLCFFVAIGFGFGAVKIVQTSSQKDAEDIPTEEPEAYIPIENFPVQALDTTTVDTTAQVETTDSAEVEDVREEPSETDKGGKAEPAVSGNENGKEPPVQDKKDDKKQDNKVVAPKPVTPKLTREEIETAINSTSSAKDKLLNGVTYKYIGLKEELGEVPQTSLSNLRSYKKVWKYIKVVDVKYDNKGNVTEVTLEPVRYEE